MPKKQERNDLGCEIRQGLEPLTAAMFRVARAIDGLKPESSKPKGHFEYSIGPVTQKDPKNMPVSVKLTNEQKVNITLSPKTDSGKPATLDGAPVWSVVSGDSTVVVAEGGLSADLVSSDTPGDTTFLIEADADLGDGVESLQDTITLTVAGANAKNLGISVGTPVLKDTPPA
jgi:hypothetical protein